MHRPTTPLAAMMAAALLVSATQARADPVYFGAAARGSIPPDVVIAFRASLERAFAKKGIKVLDASSAAEDSATHQQADARAALDEATGDFNEGDYAAAVVSTQNALTAFEQGPAFSDDDSAWALYRDILSLRALADLKLKKKKEADDALRSLLIVLPRYAPNREKAPPELIRHVDDVKDELRSLPPATIQIKSKPGGAKVIVDGKRRGRSPLLIEDLAPGVHYVELEAGGGRYTERVMVTDQGATVDARLGSKKGAAAHDVVAALQKPTSAKAFVESITDVDDDVLVAVLLPAGKKFEVLGARVVGGEVHLVCGIRTGAAEGDRERATYVLAEALLSKSDDAWLEKSKDQDVADLRPKLFQSVGSTDVTDVDPDEPAPSTSPAVVVLSIAGGVVALAAVGTVTAVIVRRELQKNNGFTFDVDVSQLPKSQ